MKLDSGTTIKRFVAALLLSAAGCTLNSAAAQTTDTDQAQSINEASGPSDTSIPDGVAVKENNGLIPKKASKEPAKAVTTPAWVFLPHVRVEEVATDNSANDSGDGRSDLVSILGVGGDLTADTPRLRLNANYLGTYNKYLNSTDLDHFSQYLRAHGDATIVPNFVFIDFQALADLALRDIGGTAGSAAFTKDNSAQTYVVAISPYARYQIGRLGDLELRYASNFTWFTGNTGPISPFVGQIGDGNQQQGKIDFSMPGTIAPGLLADAYVSAQYTDSAGIGIFRRDHGQGIEEFQMTRSVSLVGAGGYENFSDRSFPRASGEGPIWSAGFRWRPNADSSVLLTYGHYDLDNDFAGEAQYRVTPSTLFYVAYTNSISTSQQQIAGGTGASAFIQNGNLVAQVLSDSPIAGVTFDENPVIATLNKKFVEQENALNGDATVLGNIDTLTGVPILDSNSYFPLQNALFRLKSLRATLYRVMGSDIVTLEAHHNDRQMLSTFLPISQVTDGGRLSYSTQLSPYLQVVTSGGYQVLYDDQFFTQNRVYVWQATLGLQYSLGENLRAFARYDYNRDEIVEGAVTMTGQNSIGLGLSYQF